MKFHVKATSVTDWLPLCISSPQGGGGGVTVGAGQAHPPRSRLQCIKHVRFISERRKEDRRNFFFSSYHSLNTSKWWKYGKKCSSVTHQSSLGFDKRSVDAIHLVVQSAGITQVVARTIPPPKRGRHCPTVHTFSPLSKVIKKIWWRMTKKEISWKLNIMLLVWSVFCCWSAFCCCHVKSVTLLACVLSFTIPSDLHVKKRQSRFPPCYKPKPRTFLWILWDMHVQLDVCHKNSFHPLW